VALQRFRRAALLLELTERVEVARTVSRAGRHSCPRGGNPTSSGHFNLPARRIGSGADAKTAAGDDALKARSDGVAAGAARRRWPLPQDAAPLFDRGRPAVFAKCGGVVIRW